MWLQQLPVVMLLPAGGGWSLYPEEWWWRRWGSSYRLRYLDSLPADPAPVQLLHRVRGVPSVIHQHEREPCQLTNVDSERISRCLVRRRLTETYLGVSWQSTHFWQLQMVWMHLPARTWLLRYQGHQCTPVCNYIAIVKFIISRTFTELDRTWDVDVEIKLSTQHIL